jgi:GTP cyclohydrolase II
LTFNFGDWIGRQPEEYSVIVKLGEAPLKTRFGKFRLSAWYDGHSEVYSIHTSTLEGAECVPVRVHSSCVSAHYLNSVECDCREQLEIAQKHIADQGRGVIIILDQQAKANGILATLNFKMVAEKYDVYSTAAYTLMGYPADARSYLSAAFVLKEMKVASVDLLTNNPDKRKKFESFGIKVIKTTRVVADNRPDLADHYRNKKEFEGHEL